MFNPPMFKKSIQLESITFVANSTSMARGITIPSSTQAGDIIVLFDYCWWSGQSGSGDLTPYDVVPTGFTGVYTDFEGAMWERVRTSYKIAVASDSGATANGMYTGASGSYSTRKVMGVWRGNKPFLSTTPYSINYDHGDWVFIEDQTVSSGSGVEPILVLGWVSSKDSGDNVVDFSPSGIALPNMGYMEEKYKIFNLGSKENVIVSLGDISGNPTFMGSWYFSFTG